MILSFADRRTERFAGGKRVPEFESFKQQAIKKLTYLNEAVEVQDLRHPPGNRLEALTGSRAGQFSIRINLQWRICFRWPEGQDGPDDVEIVDYH